MKTIREFLKKVLEHAVASEVVHFVIGATGGASLLSAQFVASWKGAALLGFVGGALVLFAFMLSWVRRRRIREARRIRLLLAEQARLHADAMAARDLATQQAMAAQAAAHIAELQRLDAAHARERQNRETRHRAEIKVVERREHTAAQEKLEMQRATHRAQLGAAEAVYAAEIRSTNATHKAAALTAEATSSDLVRGLRVELHKVRADLQKSVAAINRAKINEQGALRHLETLRAEIRAEVQKELEAEHLARFGERTEHHHRFVHLTRDFVVKLMSAVPPSVGRTAPTLSAEHRAYLKSMLEEMAQTFQRIVPNDVKVFTWLRMRHNGYYPTELRAGQVDDEARRKGSEPLAQRSEIVKALRHSFAHNDCVVRTGINQPGWTRMRNDARCEDLASLNGAIFSKKWSASRRSFRPRRLEWIAGVSADREGAFTDDHKALLKCFNDALGVILNLLVRLPPASLKGESHPFSDAGAAPQSATAS